MLGRGRITQLQGTGELLHRLRPGLNHQNVAFADFLSRGKTRQPLAAADQAEDLDVVFIADGKQFAHGLADGQRILRDPDFDHISFEVFQFFRRIAPGRLGRDQSPADQRDIGDAGNRAGKADRCEVEHLVGRAERAFAKLGDNDIGRRSDQRDHAAEDGGEG